MAHAQRARIEIKMKCFTVWINLILKDGKQSSLEISTMDMSFLLRRFSSAIKLGFQDNLSRHTAYTYKSRNCVDNMRHQLLFHL